MSKRSKYVVTPESKRRGVLSAFRRARLDYINDLDADFYHTRDEGNRREMVRRYRKMVACFEEHGVELPANILGDDPRVVGVIRSAQLVPAVESGSPEKP